MPRHAKNVCVGHTLQTQIVRVLNVRMYFSGMKEEGWREEDRETNRERETVRKNGKRETGRKVHRESV